MAAALATAVVVDLLVHLSAVAYATPSGPEACHLAASGHDVKALVRERGFECHCGPPEVSEKHQKGSDTLKLTRSS